MKKLRLSRPRSLLGIISALSLSAAGFRSEALAAEWTVQVVAFEGDTAPGSGRPDAREDGRFTSFVAPVISPSGLVAFEAEVFWANSPSTNPSARGGIWVSDEQAKNLRIVMISGMPAPGTGGPFGNGFSEVRVDSVGNVLFDASGLSGQASLGFFHADPASVIKLVLLQTQPVPGAPGYVFGDIRNGRGFANDGYLLATEPIAGPASSVGAFEWDGDALTNVIVRGQPAPTLASGETFTSGGVLGVNEFGEVLLSATTSSATSTDQVRSLWWLHRFGLLELFRQGDPMPGLADFKFTFFNDASLNRAGRVAFAASGENQFRETMRAIFSNNGGEWHKVVSFSQDIDAFFNVLINGSGNIAFRGKSQGPGDGRDTIWIAQPGAAQDQYVLRKIVAEGMPAPFHENGVTFGVLPASFAFNALDQVAFTAKLAGPGITTTNDDSLWFSDPKNGLQMLAREGTIFFVPGLNVFARTVNLIRLIDTGSNGEDGRPTSLSEQGALTFSLQFAERDGIDRGRSDAIFLAQLSSCLVTNTADTGPGSLRTAIECANLTGQTQIRFNIPTNDPGFNGKTFRIQPLSPLPAITNREIVLDGRSQTAFTGNSSTNSPEIHLDGTQAAGAGVVLLAPDGGVLDLVISGFSGPQLLIQGSGATRNTVSGCFIGGLGPSGDFVLNQSDSRPVRSGLVIDNAPENQIGGAGPGERNVITFAVTNLLIHGNAASANRVQGNYIGLNPAGNRVISTLDPDNPDPERRILFGDCQAIVIDQAPNNLIGGTNVADRNVIAVGIATEIEIVGDAARENRIQGNYIGTDATGAVTLGPFGGTLGCNVVLLDSPANRIGGLDAGAGNLIAGPLDGICVSGDASTDNIIQGNLVGTDSAGTKPLSIATGIKLSEGTSRTVIGGRVTSGRNVVASARTAISITQAASNVVAGNFIGTDITGKIALTNQRGIVMLASSNNSIGGHLFGEGNIISGNAGAGLEIAEGTSNVVAGNYIGTDLSGEVALPNGTGILILNSQSNVVGGDGAFDGNLISGNQTDGVVLRNSSGQILIGNRIGTDFTGAKGIPNGGNGLLITDSANNAAGGVQMQERNIISANRENGVQIDGASSTNNGIINNYIGADSSGARPLGNGASGVQIQNASSNYLYANIIADNRRDGVTLIGNLGIGNRVQTNVIGSDNTTIQRLGNALDGVHIENQAGTVISANRIFFNGQNGVGIAAGLANLIRANRIGSNGQLGIDLGGDGISQNDPGDLDAGPNMKVNMPELTLASWTSAGPVILGKLESTPNTLYDIQFFANATCDPSGFGEGEDFLLSLPLLTDASGRAQFRQRLPAALPLGTYIVATATDAAQNTSEFSRCTRVERSANSVDLAVFLRAIPQPAFAGQTLTCEITVTNQGTAGATGVTLTNYFPAGVSFLNAEPGPGNSCTFSNQVLSCKLADLLPGRSHTITFTIQPNLTGTLTNEVHVDALPIDEDPFNNMLLSELKVEGAASGSVLQIAESKGRVTLSWTSASVEARVESTVKLGSDAVWTVMTNQIRVEGDLRQVSFPTASNTLFLRLR